MKCPRCGLIVTDVVPTCRGCGFGIRDLDRRLRRVPERVGLVNDFAGLLSAEEKAGLDVRLSQLRSRLGGELVLVTMKTTRPVKPSEYVFWLFNRWQVGGEARAGLMLLLAQKERRVECEVGYGWEPLLSEVESGVVLDLQVLPWLRAGQVYQALTEGVEQLAGILEQAAPSEPGTPEVFPAGGGEP